jgi:hypothetical protein
MAAGFASLFSRDPEDESARYDRNYWMATFGGVLILFWLTLGYFVITIHPETPARFDNVTFVESCRFWQLRSLSAEYCANQLTVSLSKNGQTESIVLPPTAVAGLLRYYKMCVLTKHHDYCNVDACRTNYKQCSIRGGQRVKYFLSPLVALYARYDYVNGTLVECFLNNPSGVMFSCSDLHVITASLLLDPTAE